MSSSGPAVAVVEGSPAARCLADRREALNAVLHGAALEGADPARLLGAVAEVAPVLDAVAADLSATALGDLAEALVGRLARSVTVRRWGPEDPTRWVVLDLAPRLAPWFVDRPGDVVVALDSVAAAVWGVGDAASWGRRVVAAAALGPVPDDVLRAALMVGAWRSGLTRYRGAALDHAGRLPADLAARLLELAPDEVADVLVRHRADRWWWPGPEAGTAVRRHGGFRGLGGPWLHRPVVVGALEDGWAIEADGARWVLVDDAHGSSVVRTAEVSGTGGPSGGPRPAALPLPSTVPVPWDDDVTGWASVATADGARVAVSRAHSYCVDVLRVARPAATGGPRG